MTYQDPNQQGYPQQPGYGSTPYQDPNAYPQQPYGQPQAYPYAQPQGYAPQGGKDWTTTLLLSIFLGGLGIDRFYVGKTGTGILKLLTVGGCGIWYIVDIILIVTGSFTDANGQPLTGRR